MIGTIRNPQTRVNRIGKLKLLSKLDTPPKVLLDEDGNPHLSLVRNGRKHKLHISRRVAEELIAAGINSLK